MQYTIRSIPPELDKALRQRAERSGKSLNQVTLEVMTTGAGLSDSGVVYDDLDWFIGSLDIDETVQRDASSWLDSLPRDMEQL